MVFPDGVDVGLAGIEPATSPLSGVRSNRLSYSPVDRKRYRRALTADYPLGGLSG